MRSRSTKRSSRSLCREKMSGHGPLAALDSGALPVRGVPAARGLREPAPVLGLARPWPAAVRLPHGSVSPSHPGIRRRREHHRLHAARLSRRVGGVSLAAPQLRPGFRPRLLGILELRARVAAALPAYARILEPRPARQYRGRRGRRPRRPRHDAALDGRRRTAAPAQQAVRSGAPDRSRAGAARAVAVRAAQSRNAALRHGRSARFIQDALRQALPR